MPLANKHFERLFYKLRSRAGVVLIPATDMRNSFAPHRNTQYVMGLAADQSPGHPGNAWWINFFGRPTAFVKGPAKAAIANNCVVLFAYIHKPRRGYYHAVLSTPDLDISSISEQELTRRFVRYLEDVIRQYPEMWLWSHRRWKLQWDPSYGEVIS
jgi:KDO2-lipid IV(A) lauroyltransferase